MPYPPFDHATTADRIPGLETISDRLLHTVAAAIRQGRRLSRKLPMQGRLLIDRPLPFLAAIRLSTQDDDRACRRLVTGEANYLIGTSHRRLQPDTQALMQAVVEAIHEQFGTCLLVEVWPTLPAPQRTGDDRHMLQPRFTLHGSDDTARPVLDDLAKHLGHIRLDRPAQVTRHPGTPPHPPDLPSLLPAEAADRLHCVQVGLEVDPVFRDAETGTLYPEVLRHLRRQLAQALKHTFHRFTVQHTAHRPRHAVALGPRTLDQATRICDSRLAQVADAFDVLLDVTPTNENAAWHAFQASGYEVEPEMHYRPLPIDPAVVKRELHRIPIEKVEDPTLAELFRERQVELDMQLNLLADRNTPRFVLESEQLYGRPDAQLVKLARTILSRLPQSKPGFDEDEVDAEAFASRAREVADVYRQQSDHFRGTVHVRNDVSTLITSHGCLLIDKHLLTHHERVDALVHHEISTHLLAYYNGRMQRLRQLYIGFAGYEVLQEGLAVMLEYLVGGMDEKRWRVLAARVTAIDRMLRGMPFVDTYHYLHRDCQIEAHTAFRTAMRVYRSGGFTKDLIYLQGLRDLLAHLADGGDLHVLYLGRFALHQLPAIEELRARGVIEDGWLLPIPLDAPEVQARLARLRQGVDVLDLLADLPGY